MRRTRQLILPSRRSFIAGAGAGLLAAPAIVRAGSMTLMGVGKPPAGGGGGGGTAFTWNPADAAPGITLANSNRDLTGTTAGNYSSVRTTAGKTTGLWYCEFKITAVTLNQPSIMIGVANSSFSLTAGAYLGSADKSAAYFWANQATYNSAAISNPASLATPQNLALNDIVQVALDATNGKVWIGLNNTWLAGGNPSAGTTPWLTFTAGSDTWYFAAMEQVASGNSNAATIQLPSSATFSPPTGFTVINQ